MGIVSAAQGTLDYVDPTSAFPQATGTANVDGSTATNIIKFKVTDGDLNTAASLTGAHYLLGTAGASDTFAVDATVQPVVAASSVYDLQTSSSYIPSIAPDGSSITVHTTRSEAVATRFTSADVTANVTSDTDLTADLSNTSRVKISVEDQTGTDATGTTVTVTIKGTSVNPVTLVETADVTEAETITVATGVTSTARTTTFFKAGTVSFQTSDTTTGADGYTLSLIETLTVAAKFTYGQMNDTDSGAGTTASAYSQTVTVTSTSDSSGASLTLLETTSATEAISKTSGVFQRVVANWSAWKAAKSATPVSATGVALIDGTLRLSITARQVSAAAQAHQFVSTDNLAAVILAMGENDPNVTDVASTTVDERKNAAGATWITNTASALGLNTGTATWAELDSIVIAVSNNDTVTLSYADANGAVVTKTITVDLSKPAISGSSPAGSSYINSTTPRFEATINEAGSGLDLTSASTVVVTVDAVVLNEAVTAVGGGVYQILALNNAALAAGAHTWSVSTVDKVGNTGTTGSLAFTVDTTKPTVTAAATGIGLKLATGSTTDYVEFASSDWIRVTMSEKVMSADAADFDVAGTLAADVSVQKKVTQLVGGASTDLRTNVYVKTAATLDPAAKPKVSIVGAVTDLAGNAAPTGTATGASATPSDQIKPTLTLSVSPTLGKSATVVTITVTSNEALQGDVPSIKVSAVGVATSKVATNSWTASYTISGEGEFEASADATDSAGNSATMKTAKFQGDVTGPVMSFSLVDSNSTTAGVQLETSDVLFVSVVAAESAEYVGDTHNTVTISAASLSSLTKLGGTVVGTATTLAAADFQSTDSINFVYGAADLALGAYKLSVTGTDTAGNKGSAATQEFEVVAQTSSSIAVNPGWTLISIPGAPQDSTISGVFEGTNSVTEVWSFNNASKVWEYAQLTDGVWEGTLIQITDGRAYFVRATTFAPVKVLVQRFSPQRVQPQYALTKGWNGIGYTPAGAETSIAASTYLSSLGSGGWGVVRWWNPTLQQYESAWSTGTCTAGFPSLSGNACSATVAGDAAAVKAGQGYLLYVAKDGTLAP
jgi:hypothetical protein